MTLDLDTPEGGRPLAVPVTRRGFAALVGAAGFAAAVGPAAASAIKTDEAGLVTEATRIPVGDTDLPAYIARPDGAGPFPVVLVVHEIFGVHEYIRDTARRFAKQGYFALVVDLYARAGDPSAMTDWDEIGRIVRTATHTQVMRDLSRSVDWLAETRPDADTGALAVTGFCWGGAVTWMFSAHDPRVKAGAAWYGRLVDPGPGRFSAGTERPWPVDVADQLNGAVLGLYGGQDRGIPVTDVETMRTALKKAGGPSTIVLYDDAPHGFHADYRASYREEAAQDAWSRALAWFRQYGVG